MIQWWSAVGLVGCYWSTGEDKAAEDALMGLQETGEGGGRGGARGRRRQGKRRREGSEEMGIIKMLLSVLPLQSGVVFILKYSYCSCTHTHTSSAPVRTELHLAFKASRMFWRPRDGEGEGMPVKVLLQLCSCASDDIKICVTDVLQDSTKTELHQVCMCVCGGCTFVTHSSYNDIHRCW